MMSWRWRGCDHGMARGACLPAQQAVEKGLKALLIERADPAHALRGSRRRQPFLGRSRIVGADLGRPGPGRKFDEHDSRAGSDYHSIQEALETAKLSFALAGAVLFGSAAYRAGLAGAGDLRLPHWDDPRFEDVYQNYVVRTSHRDALREHLHESGVETLLHWPKPVWRHEALALGEWHLPNTEAICREVLSLPMSAETTEDQVDYVVDVTRRFFERR
jgi:hypothetical protein